jgi:hypothetical protein
MGIGLVALVVFPAQPAAASTKAAAPACGTVVTQDLRLGADLTCAGDALVVDGAGTITVDLKGHRVTSTGGTALAVRNSTHVTVKSGGASSLTADSAVELRNLSLGELDFEAPVDARRVEVTGPTTGQRHDGDTSFRSSRLDTVTLHGVLGATFRDNVIRSLSMADAPRALVRGNVLGSLSLLQSDEVTVANNRATKISAAQSRGFRAVDNHVMGTGSGSGISLSFVEPGVQGTTVSRNTVRGAGTGISVTELLGDATFSGNSVTGNSVAGLTAANLLGGELALKGNTFSRNGFASTAVDSTGRTVNDGVHIVLRADRPGATARLARNAAMGNTGFGFEVVGPAALVHNGGRNVAKRNGEGACSGLTCR